jgi:hypothetical protein
LILLAHSTALLAAEPSTEPVLEQLDPPRRAAVVMALLGITLIGLFLVLFIMMGGHWVRRLARHRPRTVIDAPPPQEIQRQRPAQRPLPADTKSNETLLLDTPSHDTKAEG